MTDTITARDANHNFSRILTEVQEGREYVVTLHGKPVARIVPEPKHMKRVLTADQQAALDDLFATMKSARRVENWKMSRDEIYDRDSPDAI